MMFVPSIDGRSHDVSENTSEADIRRGLRVFAGAVSRALARLNDAGALAAAAFASEERTSIMKTIGVDVGGTFTDIVYCDLGANQVAIHKVSTTPDDPSRGILQGIAEICRDNGVAPGDIDYVLHGTTTATNAVLEHKGARAGMLTNEGFRDIIHIARHQRVEHYSIMQELPWQNRPLVKRRHRKVVKGTAWSRRTARNWSRSTKAACVAAARVC